MGDRRVSGGAWRIQFSPISLNRYVALGEARHPWCSPSSTAVSVESPSQGPQILINPLCENPDPKGEDGHSHEATPAQLRTGTTQGREGERLLKEGADLTEVLRHLEISEATWNRWRAPLHSAAAGARHGRRAWLS